MIKRRYANTGSINSLPNLVHIDEITKKITIESDFGIGNKKVTVIDFVHCKGLNHILSE